ncbi:hypothetical protein IEQ34_022003 [Dendrobium chrysotoxum]|uniref:Hydroxyphenylpyruvate reductase n=1 Tax=Dendrobium chrysotoxum TaxID=161865 RepID=A0AAV7FXU2_DENCH|nr:hypothetical protein IEQ34_022003 [Dendrobium chrysotoxum]
MESLGVLFTYPVDSYLEEELGRRCKLFRLWDSPPEKRKEFLRANSSQIRAVVGSAVLGADSDMIDSLPALEIVASFSVGLDKVDLDKCRKKGIRVTNTPDVLTDDVADLAIGLAISTMRQICQSDRFVRSGAWLTTLGYRLTSKVIAKHPLSYLHFASPVFALLKRFVSQKVVIRLKLGSLEFDSSSKHKSRSSSLEFKQVPARSQVSPEISAASWRLPRLGETTRKLGLSHNAKKSVYVQRLHGIWPKKRTKGREMVTFAYSKRAPRRNFRTHRKGMSDKGPSRTVVGTSAQGLGRGGDERDRVGFGLRGGEFSGKRVGIIGLGRIGLGIAKRAEAFNCTISYHSRTEKPNTNYKYYPNLINLATNSDVLFVACALTEDTYHIINREVIDALGPKGVLVNIGRGSHVDELELVKALVEGRLGGAGLDVFENEPEVPEELIGLDNVVLLPHVGSGTVETRREMANLVLQNLEAHVQKKPLLTPVV